MTEHEFWRERSTGHVYAIELEDGIVIGCGGPLTRSEIDEGFLDSFDYSRGRTEWIERHREASSWSGRRPEGWACAAGRERRTRREGA